MESRVGQGSAAAAAAEGCEEGRREAAPPEEVPEELTELLPSTDSFGRANKNRSSDPLANELVNQHFLWTGSAETHEIDQIFVVDFA